MIMKYLQFYSGQDLMISDEYLKKVENYDKKLMKKEIQFGENYFEDLFGNP